MKQKIKKESSVKKIWKNKLKILEGIWYNHIVFFFNKKHWAIKIVQHRRAICHNCPFFDEKGVTERVIIRGLPSCSICGCNINEKTACLSCNCALKDKGKTALWDRIENKNISKIENNIERWLNL